MQTNEPCLDVLLLGEAKRLVTAVESDQLRLEHGVAEDLKAGALVALDAAEAGGVGLVNGGEGDGLAGDLGHVAVADGDGHIGEGGSAGVDEAADLGVELGARDRGVVGVGDLLVDEEERGTGVGDGVGALRVLEHLVANGELGRGELPEAGLSLDGDPCHLACGLGHVDLSELVYTCAVGVEVGSEDGHVEIVHDVVEEGLCGGFLGAVVDGVELRESKADKTVSVSVLNE